MNNWNQVSLQEVCKITRGASPRPIKDWITNDLNGIPWVKISDATSSKTRFIKHTSEMIKQEGISKSVSVVPGDLIVSNSATPGLPKFMDINACIHDGWLLIREFEGIDKEFLYYLLINDRKYLVSQGTGTVFTNLKTDILKNHIIQLPNIKVQKIIASFLSKLDSKIELNQKINETLEEIAKTLFKSWFINFDPVRAKAEGRPTGLSKEISNLFPDSFEDSELGEIPKGWQITNLDALTSKFTTGLNPRQNFVLGSGDNFYVTIKNIGDFEVELDKKCDKVDNDAIKKINSRSDLKKDDILFSGIGTIGKVVYVFDEPKNWNISESVFSLRANPELTFPSVLYQLLKSYPLQGYVDSLASGSVQRGIRMGSLKKYKFSLSNYEVQKKFNEIISPLIRKISSNLKETRILISIRDTLLPKLISGELKIPDAESLIDEAGI